GNQTSRVYISYTITALTVVGNAFVDNFRQENFVNDMQFWEASMNHYLKTGKALSQSDTEHWLNYGADQSKPQEDR
ncbi:MAG: hypothetical protein PVH43_03640, partial [Desulfobacterales bacterium]